MPVAARTLHRRQFTAGGTELPAVGIDCRTRAAKQFRRVVEALEREIGAGPLSAFEQDQLRQAAALTVRGEHLQAAVIRGETINDDCLIRLTGEARRLVETLKAQATARKQGAVA
jgi:hypothetical protein